MPCSGNFEASNGSFDQNAIMEVMKECNCTSVKAVTLLSYNGGDVDKAIQHCKLYRRYNPQTESFCIGGGETTGGCEDAEESRSSMAQGDSRQILLPAGASAAGRSAPMTHKNLLFPWSDRREQKSCPPNFVLRDDHGSGSSETKTASALRNDLQRETSIPESSVAWDFILPMITAPDEYIPGEKFSIRKLAGAITNAMNINIIREYLAVYDAEVLKKEINELIDGIPILFFAVTTNDDTILRTLVTYGADLAAVHEKSKVPLLAFAIIHGSIAESDTTSTVATLLSLGASASQLPDALFKKYYEDLPVSAIDLGPQAAEYPWCTGDMMGRLQKAANLSHRYYLWRSTLIKPPSVRDKQVARLKNADPLLGLPYFLIGQTLASERLLLKLLSHIMVPSKKPLVLVFAGPSGHGKTELARRLGYLLGLDLEVVDCTIVNQEIELFGPRDPYVEASRGSPLNNFLAAHAGNPCIVFLDEFEKTTKDIHQALLLPFDNGEYQDRRHRANINCSRTIWILATNALDDTIKEFCAQNPGVLGPDESVSQPLLRQLSRQLKQNFLAEFDAPVTGRVTDFIPFLPFNQGEQAAVARKFLLDFEGLITKPVNLSINDKEQHLLGNVQLEILKDASVCRAMAAAEYHPSLGARSLQTAVRTVQDKLVEVYLKEDGEIVEDGRRTTYGLGVQEGEIVVYKTNSKTTE